MLAADGRLHGTDLATGEARVVPPPEFVTPFSRNWSLNLVDGVLYTTVGRGCGNGPVPGAPAPPPRNASRRLERRQSKATTLLLRRWRAGTRRRTGSAKVHRPAKRPRAAGAVELRRRP